MIQALKARYAQYHQEAQAAWEKAGLCDGLFGMGADPRKHPCHDDFYNSIGQWVTGFLASEPEASACLEAAQWILKQPADYKDQNIFWYLYAAQKHALPLIPLLPAAACRDLLAWYEGTYPKRDRMPVQDAVVKTLKKTAHGKNR